MERKVESKAEKAALTNGEAVIPPVVGALLEAQTRVVENILAIRRRTQRPRAQVDEHHQQDGKHPLQQLLVRQLHFVR